MISFYLSVVLALQLLCSISHKFNAFTSHIHYISKAIAIPAASTVLWLYPYHGSVTLGVPPDSVNAFSKLIRRDSLSLTPPSVGDILSERFAVLRSEVTGEKINAIRVGESLIERLRSLEKEMDSMQANSLTDYSLSMQFYSLAQG